MPHLFVNRPRLYALTRRGDERNEQFFWETVNALLYKAGGVVFVVGSIFFFPGLEAYADVGAWVFFGGSLLYLIVTGHDLAESIRYRRSHQTRTLRSNLELAAAISYVVGTLLFAVGSVLFLSRFGLIAAGAWCFIVGSLLFVAGACINILQIVWARSLLTLQLMNLTAISFVVGSVLFAVASIPYLWHVETAADRNQVFIFLAGQYLIGSILFLIGGIFNYWRAYLVVRKELADGSASPQDTAHNRAGGRPMPPEREC